MLTFVRLNKRLREIEILGDRTLAAICIEVNLNVSVDVAYHYWKSIASRLRVNVINFCLGNL